MAARLTAKERNLIKGALRRVFARSELREQVIAPTRVKHYDEKRPRVKKWCICEACKNFCPEYQLQVDHREPLVPIGKTLEEMSWDEVVSRLWCDKDNLQAICKTCHDAKSKLEREQRKALKPKKQKGRKK